MKFKTLKIFDSYVEAHLLKTKLESKMIYCFLQDENSIATNPLYSYALGGIKLKVKEEDFKEALTILEEIENYSYHFEDKLGCENCGSSLFYTNYKSIKNLKGIFLMLISFLFQTYPIYYKNVRKFKACGWEIEIK